MARLRLADVTRTWEIVAASPGRLDKIAALAELLRRASPNDVPIAVAYLSAYLPQGTIGVGWAAVRDLPPPANEPTLTVAGVDRAFSAIQASTGAGSQAKRRTLIGDLFARTTEAERRFLLGLLSGELRQGAQEGVMVEAVARAAEVPSVDVRRAAMLAGDLGAVAHAAIAEGGAGLERFGLQLLRPVQPMLAQTAADLDEALGRIRPAAVEWKLDGARIQVHRLDGEIRAFTRNLADMTGRVPEVVAAVAELPVRSIVLDGEAIALRSGGAPEAFQVTMSRFGSRTSVDAARSRTPLTAFYFDCLHLDGEDLIDRPESERFAAMAERLPETLRIPRTVCRTDKQAKQVMDDALARGHEGVMVKSLDAPYEAGRRGAGWLKVKRAHTLDLVVLAAEWGHGRRRGWLSNLHLGARDQATGGFVMLGKTFKGMTDHMLTWQTEHLLALETHRDEYTVHVRPELVVEVAFDGVQSSPRYPAGLALRFARIKGYRHDKRPEDADTIDTVRAIHAPAAGGGSQAGSGEQSRGR